MKCMTIFKQSGNHFGAAESFGLVKCLPYDIHVKKPVMTAEAEGFVPASRQVSMDDLLF